MAVNDVMFTYERIMENKQNKLVPLKPEFYSNTLARTKFHSYTIQITL